MYAVWEKRDGNSVKIFHAARGLTGQTINWSNEVLFTVSPVPEGFETFPKIFVAQNQQPEYFMELKVVTYLQPDPQSANKKIVARIKTTNGQTQDRDITGFGNISEYAVADIYPLWGGHRFYLHIVYREGQYVWYKQVEVGESGGSPWFQVVNNDFLVSNDISRWRASVDIALKNIANSNDPNVTNMQPVVTYQGKRDVIVIIQNGDGPPIEVPASYYPIYVRERTGSGEWSLSSTIYEVPNVVRSTPNIVGSKLMNSCLLSFDQNQNTEHLKVVPRWNNSGPNTFCCTNPTFPGTDARFLKGSLVNNTTTGYKMFTLSPSGSIYGIGTQSFSIINCPGQGEEYDGLSGTIVDDYVTYSFNLGNIMVNWDLVGFSTDIDTVIEDNPGFNENMRSKTFFLNDNDTVIIGRNAFYILDDSSGAINEIEYWVRLINNSSGEMHMELAHDTIHVGDTIQVEYLEGFVVRDIPFGSDSFYVQMEVDTLGGDGDGYGIGGGIGGEGEGDAPGMKKHIFWKTTNNVSNNVPTVFNLYQNFPNPFNPVTTIKFDLPKDVNVTITIYDLLGREVTRLVNNELRKAGRYEVKWNALNYASGVYVYRIEARQVGSSTGDYISTKKMVLVK